MTTNGIVRTLFAVLALPVAAEDAAEVLDRHAAARGGKAAIEAIRSIEVELTIDEGWVVDGVYRATRDGDMRIDVFADGERVFTEGLHDGAAWAMQQGERGGSPITDEEARILWRGVLNNLYGLHELERQGVEVAVSGPREIDGERFWIVDLRHQDGFEERLYLDHDTYLVVRRRSDHALHPAVDPEVRRYETRYSDFRPVAGVLYPFVTEKFDLDSGERVQLTTKRSITVNSITDRGAFAMPR